jgi:hypothetical protein
MTKDDEVVNPHAAARYASEASADRTGGVATRSAIRAEAYPRARAAVRRTYYSGCAIRRLLTRDIDIHGLIVGQGVLRHDLLLRAIGPLLRDTGGDSLRRLLAFTDGLNASRRLSGAGGNCHGQSD